MIRISDEDFASIERVLAKIVEAKAENSEKALGSDRLQRVARVLLAIRRRRSDYLHAAMFGEPAYDMLIGLYVAKNSGEPVTVARLSEIAGVPLSSAARWLEYLAAKRLVSREPHPNDRRALLIQLTEQGRQALEGLFRAVADLNQELSLSGSDEP
jgi:DNA-binding MarR family transcriptional regulator